MKLTNKIFRINMLIPALLLTIGMAGCADDVLKDPDQPNETPKTTLTGDGPFYMSFRLQMVDGVPYTRDVADDGKDESIGEKPSFEDGTDLENQIDDLVFVFFNASGEQLYCVPVEKKDITDIMEDKDTENGIELTFNTIATISLGDATEDALEAEKTKIASIDKFLLIVNYDHDWVTKTSDADDKAERWVFNSDKSQDGLSLSQIYMAFTSKKYQMDEKGGFMMSIAGHYDDQGNYVYYYQKGDDEELFFNSLQKAKNNPKDIYVERLASKIQIVMENNIKPIEVVYGTDIYTLTFCPLAWGLEAEEKKEYISKNLPAGDQYGTGTTYPSYFFEWINYAEGHRAFWATSVNFKDGTYVATGTEVANEDDDTGYSLKYNTFSQLDLNLKEDASKEGKPFTGYTYTLEHTFDVTELDELSIDNWSGVANPYAVPTSIVVRGQYQTAEYGASDLDPNPDEDLTIDELQEKIEKKRLNFHESGFYLRDIDIERNGHVLKYRLYREVDDKGNDELLPALIKEQYTVFKAIKWKENGEPTEFTPLKEEEAQIIFEVRNTQTRKWNDQWIDASNTFALQLKPDWEESWKATKYKNIKLYYGMAVVYDEENQRWKGDYTELIDNYYDEDDKFKGNVFDANRQLQEQLGYATFYHKGLAFFYSPILHYTGDYRPFHSQNPYKGLFNYNVTKNKDGNMGYPYNEYKVNHSTSDFGVVRNHIYNFTIYSISSLGYGIPGEKVIPLPEPRLDHEIYEFNMQLEILPWHIFEYTFDIQ